MSHSATAVSLVIAYLAAVSGAAHAGIPSGGVGPTQEAAERFATAETARSAGDPIGALRLFAAIVEDYPKATYPALPWRAPATVRAGQIELDLGRVEAGAARFVAVIDGEPPTEWTSRARLGLATMLLWSREWREAATLLQAIVDATASNAPDGDAIAGHAAAARLTLLHRVWLRAAAGESPWQRSGRLPDAPTLDRPIGIEAGFDSLLITDEGADSAIFVDAFGTPAPFPVADVHRPWWGPTGEGFVAARAGINAPLRVESFQFVFPEGNRQRPLQDIRAGASTPDGGWLLLDSRFERVLRFGPGGEFLGILDTGVDGEPVDLARGPQGRIFVIERRRRGVVVFDAEGVLSGGFSIDGWRQPYAVAVDATGHVYVLDRDLKRIDVFDPDGGPMWTLGPVFPGGVELRDPRDIAVDGSGRILIADRGLGTVVVVE